MNLGRQVALSAAHCCDWMHKPNNPLANAWLGDSKFNSGIKIPVIAYRMHPEYDNFRGFRNDLCLLLLERDLTPECQNGTVKPISLASERPAPGLQIINN